MGQRGVHHDFTLFRMKQSEQTLVLRQQAVWSLPHDVRNKFWYELSGDRSLFNLQVYGDVSHPNVCWRLLTQGDLSFL